MSPGPAISVVVGVGYTGRRVLQVLGERAVGLSRRSDPDLPVAVFDLEGSGSLPIELPERYSLLYTVPPSATSGPDPRLQRLLGSLATPPERFVYLSTTGVYGNRNGATVDESARPDPESARAKRRLAAEERLTQWSAAGGVDLVILRVPGIYGPGRLGIERIRDGEPVLREEDANPGNRIHVDDLVRCCLAALAPDRPAGVYNVGDGDTRSSTWFASEVARQLGIDPPPTISRAEAEQQFSERRLSFLRESRRLDLTRMRDELRPGIEYADAADGIAASLQQEKDGAADRG